MFYVKVNDKTPNISVAIFRVKCPWGRSLSPYIVLPVGSEGTTGQMSDWDAMQ
jgi:hypothetical protein